MNVDEHIARAKILIEALPYIQRFAGAVIVVKYGGAAMTSEMFRDDFAQNIVLLKLIGMHPVIVHGGGKEITHWMDKFGKEASFVDGLRVTDKDTIEIAEMVLSGKINREITLLINRYGGKAVGVSGKDGNLFIAEKVKTKDGLDLGFVGEIFRTDTMLIDHLTQQGYIPVISSIGANPEGETFNINADHVAAKLAVALRARKLIFLTDVDGIKVDGSLVPLLDLREAEELFQHPEVTGGMRPKLECAITAIKGGARDVHILNGTRRHALLLELFTNAGVGTMFTNERVRI